MNDYQKSIDWPGRMPSVQGISQKWLIKTLLSACIQLFLSFLQVLLPAEKNLQMSIVLPLGICPWSKKPKEFCYLRVHLHVRFLIAFLQSVFGLGHRKQIGGRIYNTLYSSYLTNGAIGQSVPLGQSGKDCQG